MFDVEDQSIANLVQKEKQIGLKVVTDGGFRHRHGNLDTLLGFNEINANSKQETYVNIRLLVSTFNQIWTNNQIHKGIERRSIAMLNDHYEIVGSFLRPTILQESRARYFANKITKAELNNIEDIEITELVEKEKAFGLKIVTDGDFRRSDWALDTILGFNGIQLINHNQPNNVLTLNSRITCDFKHPLLNAFRFLKKVADDNNVIPKQCLPSPSQCYLILLSHQQACDNLQNIYQDMNELIADLGKAYHSLIIMLYKIGCRYIQLDDRTWSIFTNNEWKKVFKKQSDINNIQNYFLRINNRALTNLPNDLIISTHICHGDQSSNWIDRGGYDVISKHLFKHESVNKYILEYDNHDFNHFSPLKEIQHQKVVLGIISSKTPLLESIDDIIKRIKVANKYIPLNQLAISPQCGFASKADQYNLTEDQQWNKIKLIVNAANRIWN